MYVVRRVTEPEGLGIAWFIPIIVGAAATVGTSAVQRLISGPSGPSQRELEEQIKLQHQLEIQRMVQAQQIQQQQVGQLSELALPALGVFALVMLLR